MLESESVFPLSAVELRVLGALMEKSVTTPEYYPMTLNSLVAACNQRTSRDPVTDYDDGEVTDALDVLRAKGLARRVDMAGARAPKFRHVADEALDLDRPSFALLAVLFLRGPQTLGQLRARTERLHAFRDLGTVQEALERMETREVEPHQLVRALPRRAGSKEIRHGHILGRPPEESEEPGGEEAVGEALSAEGGHSGVGRGSRIEALEARVRTLEDTIGTLRRDFEAFRKEFE